MSPATRRLVLVFALLGLGASASATYVHYRMLQSPGYLSFCDINATFSCTEVYQSRYGTIWGVPVALAGLVWFTLVLALWVAADRGPAAVRENMPAYLFALSTLGLAVVLYLGYASFFLLKTVCVLCVLTYVAVVGIFIVSGAGTTFPMTTLPRRAARDLRTLAASPLALAVAVLFVAGAASAIAFFPHATPVSAQAPAAGGTPSDTMSEFERWYASQERVTVPVPNDGAAVLVVKFNDYQCPPCRNTYLQYKSVFAKYKAERPGKVKFVTRDFPLESECNSLVTRDLHPSACEAAVAVRLARTRGRDEEMESWLFTNQATMTPQSIKIGFTTVTGLTDYFDVRYTATLDAVKADVALGRLLNVRQTPTFFVNGVKIEGGLPPELFDAAIAYELKKAGQ